MNLIKSHKIVTATILVGIIGSAVGIAVIGNQEKPQAEDNKSINIEERVKPVIQPETNPVEKEVEVAEPVEGVQPTNQAQTFKPEYSNNTDDEDIVDEPVEKLYGTSFGYGCTKDKVYKVIITDFTDDFINSMLGKENTGNYLWKDSISGRSHCSPVTKN